MKVEKKAITLFAIVLLAGAVSAQADYITSYDTNVSGDFSFGAIGRIGGNTPSSSGADYSTLGQVTLQKNYAGAYSQVLNVATYADTYAEMVFTFRQSPDVSRAGLGARLNSAAGQYSYGYIADIRGQGTSTGQMVLSIGKQTGYSTYVDLGTYTLSGLAGGAAVYTLDLSVVADGDNAQVTAELYEGTTLLKTLAATDTSPSFTSGGYAGLFGGQTPVQAGKSDKVTGINVTDFSVSSIPEPATLSLLGLGLLGLLRRRQ